MTQILHKKPAFPTFVYEVPEISFGPVAVKIKKPKKTSPQPSKPEPPKPARSKPKK